MTALCSRCRGLAPRLYQVELSGRHVADLCMQCSKELYDWTTHMPCTEQDWTSIGAIDGEKMIERYDLKEGLE